MNLCTNRAASAIAVFFNSLTTGALLACTLAATTNVAHALLTVRAFVAATIEGTMVDTSFLFGTTHFIAARCMLGVAPCEKAKCVVFRQLIAVAVFRSEQS